MGLQLCILVILLVGCREFIPCFRSHGVAEVAFLMKCLNGILVIMLMPDNPMFETEK